jgi:MFS family permease
VQGVASGVLGTVNYSYVPILFPKDIPRIMGILEFVVGFSMAIGGNIG